MKGIAVCLALAAVPAQAQRLPENAITVGVERIFADYGEDGFPVFMLRHTALGANGAGVEFGFAMAGAMPIGLEIGPSFTAGNTALLHVRGGVSLLMLVIPGAYVGGAITLPVTRDIGIRFDSTYRVFFAGDTSAGLASVGVGVSFFSGRREPERPRAPCDCADAGQRP